MKIRSKNCFFFLEYLYEKPNEFEVAELCKIFYGLFISYTDKTFFSSQGFFLLEDLWIT